MILKTIKYTQISPEVRLSLKVNIEEVYKIFVNNEEIHNTLDKKEAYYYFEEFKHNDLIK